VIRLLNPYLTSAFYEMSVIYSFSCTIVFGTIIILAWRLLFHPLRGFPGPFIAAASSWYEFYYDFIQGGTFVQQFPELHKRYGILNSAWVPGA
jgi:hypothetical protein